MAIAVRSAARSALRRGAVVLLVTLAVVAVTPTLLPLIGYRPLVVRSGSMEPTLMTGDAIVTRIVGPSEVRVGQVITFVDATRGNALVSHRVTEMTHSGGTYSFVTRGDMNTGVERWTIDDQGTLGRLALRIPKLGFVVARISEPGIRALLLGLPVLWMAAATVRRIWSRPSPPSTVAPAG